VLGVVQPVEHFQGIGIDVAPRQGMLGRGTTSGSTIGEYYSRPVRREQNASPNVSITYGKRSKVTGWAAILGSS